MANKPKNGNLVPFVCKVRPDQKAALKAISSRTMIAQAKLVRTYLDNLIADYGQGAKAIHGNINIAP